MNNTAQPTLYKTPSAVRACTVSFVHQLEDGDLLTGTPTVAATGLTLSVAAVNTSTKRIQVPGNADHHAKAGQAVTFTISGGSVNTSYQVTVTCGTVGGQTLQTYVNVSVDDE